MIIPKPNFNIRCKMVSQKNVIRKKGLQLFFLQNLPIFKKKRQKKAIKFERGFQLEKSSRFDFEKIY